MSSHGGGVEPIFATRRTVGEKVRTYTREGWEEEKEALRRSLFQECEPLPQGGRKKGLSTLSSGVSVRGKGKESEARKTGEAKAMEAGRGRGRGRNSTRGEKEGPARHNQGNGKREREREAPRERGKRRGMELGEEEKE